MGVDVTVSGGLLPLSCRSLLFLCVRVISTLSFGYVRAPLPYRLVNAGLFDYKKKKKKNKSLKLASFCSQCTIVINRLWRIPETYMTQSITAFEIIV